MPFSRLSRVLTLLLAAIQFAAPAVASVAEGSFSNRVTNSQAHVEAAGQRDCAPPHAADCAICRFLSDNAGDQPLQAAWEVSVASQPDAAALVAAGSGPTRQGFDARGPPALQG